MKGFILNNSVPLDRSKCNKVNNVAYRTLAPLENYVNAVSWRHIICKLQTTCFYNAVAT